MRPMFHVGRALVAAALILGTADALHGQSATSLVAAPRVDAGSASPSGGHSFAIEAAGGIAGSMLGFGVIYLANDRCEVEDLGCTLEAVFTGMLLGTVTSAGGTYFAGKAGDTDPSLLGASLGAIVGAGAGVGLWHLFTEELNIGGGEVTAVLSYTVAQGLTAALGSRLLRRLRRRALSVSP